MDAATRYREIVALLPVEQQAAALARQAELMPLMGSFAPEVTPGQIGSIADSRLGDAQIGQTRERLERALAKSQGATADLAGSISGPRAVPSAWGPMLVKQAPVTQLVNAIRAYKGGQDVEGTEKELAGQYGTQRDRLRDFLTAQQGQYGEANRQGMGSAAQRILAVLSGGL